MTNYDERSTPQNIRINLFPHGQSNGCYFIVFVVFLLYAKREYLAHAYNGKLWKLAARGYPHHCDALTTRP